MIYFEHKRLYRSIKENLPDGDFTVPIGVAELRQAGRDLSIITYGGTLGQCLDAAQIVGKEDGLSIEILDLRIAACRSIAKRFSRPRARPARCWWFMKIA